MNLRFEKKLFRDGYDLIVGVDEAGRGPWAGPVVAACVSLGPSIKNNKYFKEIRDSKKTTLKKREELFLIIPELFEEVGVGICDNQEIDQYNILGATFLAMRRALKQLKNKPNFITVDGHMKIPQISTPQTAVKQGDNKVLSIAAASIIAKVTRDRLMHEFHEQYPQYGFDRHKGYGTKLHQEALKKYGPCPFHRRSFAPIKNLLSKNL